MLTFAVVAALGQVWTCEGQPPLPAGEAVEYETGFAAVGRGADLAEQAKLEGIAALTRRFCPQLSDDCRLSLRKEIASGVAGQNDRGTCVVVYVPASRLTRWKASRAVTEFEEQLTPRVRSLLERAGHSTATPLTVSAGLVEDMPGAPVERVSWVRDQLEKALTAAGARLGPSNIILAGRIYGRTKEERLDLAIDLSTADGRYSESLTFSPLAAGTDSLPSISLAQSGLKGRVALLPLQLGSSSWTSDQINSFNLLIKQESGAQLNDIGYAVEPVSTTRQGPCDDRCAAEAARRVGATHFITGSVTLDDGSSTVYLFLREVGSLAQKGELRLEGTTTKDLRRDFASKAAAFFARMVADVKTAGDPPVMRSLSWVAVGTGAVAMGVGLVFRVLAESAVSGNMMGRETATGLVTNSITEQRALSAVMFGTISNVLLGAGAGLTGLGVVGLIVTPSTNGALLTLTGRLP